MLVGHDSDMEETYVDMKVLSKKLKLWRKKAWANRESFTPGHKNIKNGLLMNPKDIVLPLSHTIFGLIKHLVKAMDKDGSGFSYPKDKFR